MPMTVPAHIPPLSLYIHVPWCIQKCPYCDFNSHKLKTEIDETAYINKLLLDLEHDLPFVAGRKIHSIFIGGGTPSLLSAQAMATLLSGIQKRIPFENDAIEITMEANPGTFEAEKFRGFAQAGVNRLSIGVQSFNDKHLKKLGRIHDSDQAQAAAKFAHEAGFNSFNLDIMHGLPEQSLEQALDDLKTAISLKPDHISWYQLTLEPNTLFYQKPPRLPQEETLWDIQEEGLKLLEQAGYTQYETSAFARKPQLQSQHNRNYWQFGDYLGIGAGAHGKITQLTDGELTIKRTHKKRHPKDYQELPMHQVATAKIIPPAELPFEFMLNALRLLDGVPLTYFSERTGLGNDYVQPIMAQLVEEGLLKSKLTESALTQSVEIIAPTEKGAMFLNDILERFMVSDD